MTKNLHPLRTLFTHCRPYPDLRFDCIACLRVRAEETIRIHVATKNAQVSLYALPLLLLLGSSCLFVNVKHESHLTGKRNYPRRVDTQGTKEKNEH